MDANRAREILKAASGLAVGVAGDFCLDAYWALDASRAERSIETGRPVRLVASQRYELGGAGNVVANLAALGVRRVRAIGLIGDDPFAGEMRRLMSESGIDATALLAQPDRWETPVYIKPLADGVEQDRIDLGTANEQSGRSGELLAEVLAAAWSELDALIVNQQLARSLWGERLIAALGELVGRDGPLCVLDSRHRPGDFPPMAMKLNEQEAGELLGRPGGDALDHARRIFERTGRPVLITRGRAGSVVVDAAGRPHEVPAVAVSGPIDPVGAGDAAVAAFACGLASGASAVESAELAAAAAAVTVTKIGRTGTATAAEVLAALP